MEWLYQHGWWLFGIPAVFLLIVLWVFRPGAKKRYQKDGEIPFHERDTPHRHAG
jgi:cbb3-type cytochrome oxidase subunit 3